MAYSKTLDPNISSSLMDHIPVGILEIDPSGVIMNVNKAGKSWARSNKFSEIIGQYYLILISDKDKEGVSKMFNRACKGKTVRTRFSTTGNQSIRALFAPIISESGEVFLINCILQDVTAQILFRTKIREDRSRFKVAERLVQLGYCDFDLTTGKGWASDLYYEIFGLDKSNRVITIDRWINLLHPDDQQYTRERVRDFLAGDNNEMNFSYRIKLQDGSARTIQAIVIIIRNSDNKASRLITIAKDDTERTNAIETLQQNERVLRKAQQMAKIGSWKCDLQSGKLEWSEETYRMFNLPVGTPVFIPDFERFIHEQDRTYVDESWQAGLKGMPYDLTYRVIVNGEVKWIREQAEFERDKSGMVMHGFGTVQDITDLRELHNANQVFNQSQAMSGIGSWRYNLKAQELYWSDSIYKLFCISRQQHPKIYYSDYINAVYFEDRYKIKEASDITLRTKEPYELSYRIQVGPEEFRWILEKGDVLLDDHSEIIEMYGIVRDITEEHNTMVELIKARQRAEESDAIKDEFLSVMSHEVRTPLNSVIGLSNLLLRRNPKPEQMEILKTLKGSADNLLHLVNDILDFNKIKAGKLELESIPFDINAFLQQLHASFKMFAQDKALDFIIQLDPRVPNQLIGDITRLNQVFNNLLNNAIKFTHAGFVKLSVDLKSIDNNTCTLLFEVEDSGVGIAYDKQSLIFNPFQQSEINITRQYGGTGLGLSIVKRLVEIMKGNIYLKSHLGKGTIFTLEFKFDYISKSKEQEPVVAPAAAPTHIPDKERISVLYVEDVMSNRFLIENLLSDNQMKCTSVASGKEALKLTLTEKFDVVLMDLQMPEMDGYQVSAKIRKQREGKNTTTPIIAFTAKPYSEALRTNVLEHDIQDLLNKPFEIDVLLEKIVRVVTSGSAGKKVPLLSFDYYARIFEKDLSKLNEVKTTVIKECKQFERKLHQHAKAHDLKGIREEVHKMRPIMKNLNYTELYDILNNHEWPARYSIKLNEWVMEVRKLVRKGIKELEHLE